jgi:hypothetical protein
MPPISGEKQFGFLIWHVRIGQQSWRAWARGGIQAEGASRAKGRRLYPISPDSGNRTSTPFNLRQVEKYLTSTWGQEARWIAFTVDPKPEAQRMKRTSRWSNQRQRYVAPDARLQAKESAAAATTTHTRVRQRGACGSFGATQGHQGSSAKLTRRRRTPQPGQSRACTCGGGRRAGALQSGMRELQAISLEWHAASSSSHQADDHVAALLLVVWFASVWGQERRRRRGEREEWDRAEERGGSGGHNGAAGQNDVIGETGNDHGIFIAALCILKTNMLLWWLNWVQRVQLKPLNQLYLRL